MRKNKWKVISAAGLCVLLFAIYSFRCIDSRYRLEIVQVEEYGYGYKVYEGKRTIIVQPFIPVISGKKSFKTRKDAEKVGTLVLRRIEAGEDFSISREDLKELNVCLND